MTRSLFTLALLLVLSVSVAAQGRFARGEVIVAGSRDLVVDEFGNTIEYIANLRVHRSDGSFARELATTTSRLFTEPLVLNQTVFVGMRTPEGIERFTADGTQLTPFATDVASVNWLSPRPGGGIIAANGSGEIYVFSANGTLTAFRDFTQSPKAFGGIDLARDGCTVFFAGSGAIARWNTCANTPAVFLEPGLDGALTALRILPDGTFLVAVIRSEGGRVLRVASDGSTIIRTYPIPGNALALDVDGTSFWTNAGNFLLKVDIATGAILSETFTDFLIEGISVVGEPRASLAASAAADVPTISPPVLVGLMLTVAAIAVLRLRALA